MKLLFITPPMGNWAPWGDRHLAVNSLHAQVAAFIREKKAAEVSVLDCRALAINDDQMIDEVKRQQPDAVFFGAMIAAAGGAATLNRFHAAMQKIKEIAPQTVTIGGGLMYTAVPQKIMTDNPQLDFAIVGVFADNEYAVRELLEELKKPAPDFSGIKGLAYRQNGEVVLTPPRPVIANLDDLPLPAYDLFPMDKYYGYSVIPNYNESVTSRGCEGACHFCYEWWLVDQRNPRDFSSHRTKGGKRVADEMELLNKTYGVKALTFMDDDFNSDRQKMVDLVEALEAEKAGHELVHAQPGAELDSRHGSGAAAAQSRFVSSVDRHRRRHGRRDRRSAQGTDESRRQRVERTNSVPAQERYFHHLDLSQRLLGGRRSEGPPARQSG